jgi:hypothetical protein
MKDVINALEKQISSLNSMNLHYDRIALEHGSADQTRAMYLESIFMLSIDKIQAAVNQLKILERELY